jgi:N-acetylmuramoyl-L-alanine amidase
VRLETALLRTNFRAGRVSKYDVDTIVIHVTEGDIGSVRSWFNNPEAQASAHYCVTRDGTIVQFVREEDTAWHAGRVSNPTAGIVKERLPANPNGYSIGIEHEGSGDEELTDPQRAASLFLIRDIAKRHTIPLDRRHIIRHHEVFSAKSCPGAIDVDRLVQEAAQPGTVVGKAPRVVYSPQLRDYLVVTRYVSDTEWSFVRAKDLPNGTAAGAPLSTMPLHP